MNAVASAQESRLFLVTPSPENRSVSPVSPSREARGIRLFRAISRKLARRSNENLGFSEDPDNRSFSSDSCSSSSTNRSSRLRKDENSKDSGFRSLSPNQMSSSSSETGSDIQNKPRHSHSISAESIRKIFMNLNLNSRSQSCSSTKEKRKSRKPAPKRILRQPVTYTYVKGLSGLPTQRVPKNSRLSNNCNCSFQYMSGLNR